MIYADIQRFLHSHQWKFRIFLKGQSVNELEQWDDATEKPQIRIPNEKSLNNNIMKVEQVQ